MAVIRTIDEFKKAYEQGLGRPLPLQPWRTVTHESITRFGEGIGDHNPLWRDADYAREGRFGDLIACPTFIFSVNIGVMASIYGHIPYADVSTRDVTLLYLGAEIEWHRPMWLGDRIRAVEKPLAVERMSTRQIKDGLVCTGETTYWNSRGELVATLTNTMFRFLNTGEAVQAAKGDGPKAPGVAPDPLVHQRVRRGAEPRFWESVKLGDKVDDLPKGTYTTTELYLFSYVAQEASRLQAVEEGVVDMGAAGRADADYAREHRAQEGNFDWGPQRVCWMTQVATDWMGDWGTLKRIKTRIRRPNLVGDLNTLRGEVIKRYTEDDLKLVDIRVEVVNQSGAVTAEGTATIELPDEETMVTAEWRGGSVAGAGGVYR